MYNYPLLDNTLNACHKHHKISKLSVVRKIISKKVYKKFGNHKKRTLSLHRQSRTESPQPSEKVFAGFFLCYPAPVQKLLEWHFR